MGRFIGSRLRRTSCARAVALAACVGLAWACKGGGSGGGDGGGGGNPPPTTKLDPAFGGLTFSLPVKLVQHPSDSDRWYVVEQGGKIWTFLASNPAATKTLALDIVASQGINLGAPGEQGLLGLAFDPDFGPGGELYLTYTDETANASILARYQSADDDGPFTPTGDPIVLAIPHPAPNHNGGDIEFGTDRFLYYSMGDGADGSNGQKVSALLGKVLRIDVLGTPASGEKYAVPNANPFQTAGRPFCDSGQSPTAQPCPEIFAYGFRNPWRMNFDPATDQLWIGDVGESRREEIDVVLSGRNYGWNCVEGDLLGPNLGPECNGIVSEPPEVVHDRTDAQAIIGGAVYRGSAIPALVGFYVYGDDITQRFFAFHIDDTAPPTRLDLDPKHVSAFGQGRDGEIYVVSLLESPSIYKIAPAP